MAVAFANNWDIILSKLESLFRAEFKGALKVYSGLQNEMEGNQYLRLSPISSSLVDYSTTLETREFVIGMALYFNEPNIKKAGIDNVMRLVSRIETIIANNNSITLPDGSVAYDCKIESSEIEASDSEYLVQFNFRCTHANSISFPTIAITAAEVLDGATSEDATLSLTFKTSYTTTNFVTGDVTVAGGSLGSISGSGTTFTATFTPVSSGAKTIQVVAGKFTDYSGNKNVASDVFNWTYTERFISTWLLDTDSEAGRTVTLPLVNDGNTINFDIDWGDGDTATVTAYNDSDRIHEYEETGTKTITIGGTNTTISGWKFNDGGDKLKIRTITNWGTLNISTNAAFYGCTNLNVTATNAPTRSSTDLSNTFNGCAALTSIGGDWDVSNVTSISDMFYGATLFNGDISDWNTGAVQYMVSVFYGATNFNQDIGSWVTSEVTSFVSMFYGARAFDQDISNWDTSSVTNMSYMFFQAVDFDQALPTIGDKWNVSNVTSFALMFYGASEFNGNISNWTTSTATSMASMFYNATSFNGDISGWDVADVTNMAYMFHGASTFNQDISSWHTGAVTGMNGMFQGAADFNQNINTVGDDWDVSSVEYMSAMFYQATDFDGDISDWDVSSVTTMQSMFNQTSFNQDISDWETGAVLDMSSMFRTNTAFNQAIPRSVDKWDTSAVTTMRLMFNGATDFNGNIGSWNTANVTLMDGTFDGATEFNNGGSGTIDDWDVSSVTTMSQMFSNASKFNQNISSWVVSSVTNFTETFNGATIFNQNIGSWNTGEVTSTYRMFRSAPAFNQNIGSWNMSKNTYMQEMFKAAGSFNQDISSWDVTKVESFTNFLQNSNALSTANYNLLLIAWEADNPIDGLSFHGGDATTSTGGGGVPDGTAARARLVNNHAWSIQDGD